MRGLSRTGVSLIEIDYRRSHWQRVTLLSSLQPIQPLLRLGKLFGRALHSRLVNCIERIVELVSAQRCTAFEIGQR
jgi:hypothetical protein